jgi:hypothetical protein
MMTKTFLTYSAIVEAVTGIGLIIFPARVAEILLHSPLNNSLETLLAMIGGAAICSLALSAWLVRSAPKPQTELKMLLCYNLSVSIILIYGVSALGFKGIVLWIVIVFHLIQAAICLLILQKKLKPD